jgi:putative ABC transport system permease protein
MNLLTIAAKSLRQRALSSSLTMLSVALGIMLMVAVLVINSVVSDTFSQRSIGYNLVIGPPGSDLANVLSAVYRIGKPRETLPYRILTEDVLGDDKKWKDWIHYAIPIAMGDVTEIGGFPIVGTTPKYFVVEYGPGKKFGLDGKLPIRPFDAVIGARVARENDWTVGSEFRLIHGGAESDHVHDEKFTITGLLAPTGTPNDRTVFVNLEGFFLISGHEKPPQEAIERLRRLGFVVTPQQEAEILAAGGGHDDHGHDHAHHHAIPDDMKELSFILVRMKDDIGAMGAIMMVGPFNEGLRAQAVNPVFPMNQLMKNFVGNFRQMLLCLTFLIVIVAGVGIFVSIYNSMADRKREIAIMRALGAHRGTVFSIILGESLLLCLGGGVLGLLLGHGLVIAVTPIVESRAGIIMNPFQFEPWELVLFPVLMVLASLVGFLPGLTAYRTDVADSLSD